MMYVIPLVSLSPDYPTLILRTSFSILISLIGFSFSASGFLATFLDMWAKIYQLNIINQYLIFICTLSKNIQQDTRSCIYRCCFFYVCHFLGCQ